MHNSVSIHIRRGDYVSLGIPLLPLDFYTNAIVEMEKINGECNYYVFSDDPDLAKTFLPDNRPFTYINCNIGKDSFRDMQLMSMCRHNIIANSTFSFWAAFLNENVNKTVIAPKTPFPGCKYPFACDDWILL